MKTRPLSESQRFVLVFWWTSIRNQHDVDFDIFDRKQTVEALERRGLVRNVRPQGTCWLADLTEDGLMLAEELGREAEVVAEAEKAIKESSPEAVMARRWDEALGHPTGRHSPPGRTHVNVMPDGKIYVHLTIRFANERSADAVRLDVAALMLKYNRGGGRRFGEEEPPMDS